MYDHEHPFSEDLHESTDLDFTQWLVQDRTRAVTFIAPGGDSSFGGFDASLVVEVLPSEPAVETDAESVADFDLAAPSGRVDLAPSGGMEGITAIEVPAGEWQARWSGFGETAATEQAFPEDVLKSTERPDHYLLQLWSLDSPAQVVLRR